MVLRMVNQKSPCSPEIGSDAEARRIGQLETAVDKSRKWLGKHGLERVLHGVVLEKAIAAG